MFTNSKYGFELNRFKMGIIIYYIKIDLQTEPVEK